MKRYLIGLLVFTLVLIILLHTLVNKKSELKITAVGDIRISERFIKNDLPQIQKIQLDGVNDIIYCLNDCYPLIKLV